MKTIHKIKVTERLLQVHFFQIYQKYKSEHLSGDIRIDEEGIEKKYPNLLIDFNFKEVDLDFLFNQISIETSCSKNALFNAHQNLENFFYFSDSELEDTNENTELGLIPFLFNDYEESPFNDLIRVTYYGSIFLFNQNGELIYIGKPNLFDNGYCSLVFINEYYFATLEFDENNGNFTRLGKYSVEEKRIISDPDFLYTWDQLDLLHKNNVNWKIEDLSAELRWNENALIATLKFNNHYRQLDEENPQKQIKETVLENLSFYGCDLVFADDIFKKDREIVLAAVDYNGLNLQYAQDFIGDKEVVLIAIKQDAAAFKYCSETLRNDEGFIIDAGKLNIKIMEFVNSELINKHKKLQDLNSEYDLKLQKSKDGDYSFDDLPF